ncbi:hypothetical protein, partial [Salmonella sp. s59033]|uniref:hypothetical protein n=1 Tax=Salmonella sp. s59033 TaxID=3159713 RepID=UPI00398143E9
ADAANAPVGEGSASDVVATFVGAAVERLAVTAGNLLFVGWGLGRLGGLGRRRRRRRRTTAGKGKGASGKSKEGDNEELHVEGWKSVCLERRC